MGLWLVPRLLQRLHAARRSPLAHMSPVARAVLLLLAYAAAADLLEINQLFAGLLAGLALARSPSFVPPTLEAIAGMSNALFIPLYFALVGYKLAVIHALAPGMLCAYLVVACVIKLASVALGARLAGFPLSDALNLAVATNARGGPGIAVASVAFDAGIISPTFYTTLVAVAVLTSQAAGAWLGAVLRRGQPLLSGATETPNALSAAHRNLVVPGLVPGESPGRQG